MTPPTSPKLLSEWMVVKMQSYDNTQRFHSRRHPRLKQYDYATPNYYFVTICTWNKTCILGKPGNLNRCGQIAEQGLKEIQQHFPTVQVNKYVVMPNHIHAIIILQENNTNLSTVIGQYKAYVTKQIRAFEPGKKVWQSSYHDHVIRDQKGYEHIWLYIESNPASWKKDCFYTV